MCVLWQHLIYLHIPSLHRNQASLGGVDLYCGIINKRGADAEESFGGGGYVSGMGGEVHTHGGIVVNTMWLGDKSVVSKYIVLNLYNCTCVMSYISTSLFILFIIIVTSLFIITIRVLVGLLFLTK